MQIDLSSALTLLDSIWKADADGIIGTIAVGAAAFAWKNSKSLPLNFSKMASREIQTTHCWGGCELY